MPWTRRLREAYETCRRMHRRHDPTYYWATRRLPAEVRPATHALYGYVRTADEIVDGPRRPPTPRRAAPRWTPGRPSSRRGLRVAASRSCARSSTPAARHDLPLGELRDLHGLDARRLRARADRELGRARRLHGRLGRLGRADHGRRCSACPRAITPTSAGSGSRSSSPTSSATCARTAAGPHLPARRRIALASASARPTSRARRRHAGAARAARPRGRARPRACSRGARPAIAPRRPRVRPGIRLARAVYGRVLDRVEATGFDVLGRAPGVRVWQLPGAATGRCDDPPRDAARRRAHAAGRARAPTC